jgi:shikimate kinase
VPTAEPAHRTIVLIGFMAAGKSTVGRRLARRLGWRFIDLDREIERRAGATIAEIFAAHGEAGFRLAEEEATAALPPLDRTVLAVGGGWFLNTRARARFNTQAFIVWLRISPAESVRRLNTSKRPRPLLAGADPLAAAEALLREREAVYGQADAVVDVDGRAVYAVADEIARMINRPRMG